MNRNEVRKKMKDAIKTRFGVHGKVIRCPSIEVMAKYIATYLRLECRISDWTSSTDRSISGSRLRRPGLGREGKRLEVVDENSTTIFDHRTGDTYRHNTDVAR